MFQEEGLTKNGMAMPHGVALNGRERLVVSGVEDVESFDENAVCMFTTEGILTVTGEDLHIDRLSLDNGEVSMTGRIHSLEYEDGERAKGGFLSRLFG